MIYDAQRVLHAAHMTQNPDMAFCSVSGFPPTHGSCRGWWAATRNERQHKGTSALLQPSLPKGMQLQS